MRAGAPVTPPGDLRVHPPGQRTRPGQHRLAPWAAVLPPPQHRQRHRPAPRRRSTTQQRRRPSATPAPRRREPRRDLPPEQRQRPVLHELVRQLLGQLRRLPVVPHRRPTRPPPTNKHSPTHHPHHRTRYFHGDRNTHATRSRPACRSRRRSRNHTDTGADHDVVDGSRSPRGVFKCWFVLG